MARIARIKTHHPADSRIENGRGSRRCRRSRRGAGGMSPRDRVDPGPRTSTRNITVQRLSQIVHIDFIARTHRFDTSRNANSAIVALSQCRRIAFVSKRGTADVQIRHTIAPERTQIPVGRSDAAARVVAGKSSIHHRGERPGSSREVPIRLDGRADARQAGTDGDHLRRVNIDENGRASPRRDARSCLRDVLSDWRRGAQDGRRHDSRRRLLRHQQCADHRPELGRQSPVLFRLPGRHVAAPDRLRLLAPP